jgi:hypothetical protein
MGFDAAAAHGGCRPNVPYLWAGVSQGSLFDGVPRVAAFWALAGRRGPGGAPAVERGRTTWTPVSCQRMLVSARDADGGCRSGHERLRRVGWLMWCHARDARPYLGARGLRRHDGGWGDPERVCGRSFCKRLAGAGRQQGTLGAGRGFTSCGRWRGTGVQSSFAGVQAWSPSARRVWWQRRTSLRATDRVARSEPSRCLSWL